MDTNEKKPRRPRIGENRQQNPAENADQNFQDAEGRQNGEYTPRHRDYSSGPRQYGNQGAYRNNYRNNRYPQRDQWNQRRRYDQADASAEQQGDAAEAGAPEGENNYRQQQGYRRYNNQGGYQNRGGYNRDRQGGYQNRGYNQNRQPLGGYRNNDRQPQGYQQEGGEGGYRQQGYNQNRGYRRQEGGYQNRGYNQNRQQQGGYRDNRRQQPRRDEFGMPRGGKSFVPRPKRVEYEQEIPDPNEQIRLNKFMANAGICSRREADEHITNGLVKVNGETVTELGTKISHNDTVEFNGKVVTLESKCYILLNKPKDCVTTSDDPNGRLTVMDLVKNACEERIYPVGRLDRNTTGVLLLTNDGDLASKLTHPKFVKKKIYHVWTDKDITEDDMQQIADGIELEDGPIHADAISYATDTDRNQAGIEIHSGRNRIVRRIFEHLGYHVTKLDRVYFAGLTKKNLPRGRWRYLTQEEVNFLKMGSFE